MFVNEIIFCPFYNDSHKVYQPADKGISQRRKVEQVYDGFKVSFDATFLKNAFILCNKVKLSCIHTSNRKTTHLSKT